MRKKTIIGTCALATTAVLALGLSGCASCDRLAKSWDSELARWEGKIDLQVSEEGGHVLFDQDGKRAVIAGGIVVSEEV